MKTLTIILGFIVAVLLCGCAIQDDIYTLNHRISALERRSAELEKQNRELEALNRELTETKKNIANRVEGIDKSHKNDELELRGKYASLAADFDASRQEIQALSGRLEQIEYLLDRKMKGFEENQRKNRDRLDSVAMDLASLKKRPDTVDGALMPEGGVKAKRQASVPSPAPANTTKRTQVSEQTLYRDAKAAFDNGKMEAARGGFEKLIAAYPKSNQADNAQFWIGETYYNEKWYEKAILEYQKVIENYPSGNKIPAALLKQGLSFLNIGEKDNARLLLKELVAKHPGTNEAGIAKKKLESM